MLLLLVLLPALAGGVAFLLRSDRARLAVLVAATTVHAALCLATWALPPPPELDGDLALDPLGRLFLTIGSLLVALVAVYTCGWAGRQLERSNRLLTGGMLILSAAMTLVAVSVNLGLLWVAIEAASLASAPLIYYHRSPRALEATWKYIIICSVGIALALLGTFFLAMAGAEGMAGEVPLRLDALMQAASQSRLSTAWLRGAYVLLLIGYGTKMGLAPLHTWKPDAYSEAPAPAAALLASAMVNCGLLGVLRVTAIVTAAGQGAFAHDLLVALGLVSLGVAAAFMISQRDYPRLLAYSGVEHVGIMAIGVGVGGAGTFGALLHAVNHSLAKALLFLAAGNLMLIYKSRQVADIRGGLARAPVTSALFLLGFLAITGTPPFGPFFSEFTILAAAVAQGRFLVAALYLGFLALVFIGMTNAVLAMTQGEAPAETEAEAAGTATEAGRHHPAVRARETLLLLLPPAVLAAAVLCLGVWLPPELRTALEQAAQTVGGIVQ